MKNGYVYLNISDSWKKGKDGVKSYSDHQKVCIGILVDPKDKGNRKLYANAAYFKYFLKTDLPERNERADSISVGVYLIVQAIADDTGLTECLNKVFGENASKMILDLAMYMLSEETAVFQHYPHWARAHETFTGCIRSDSFISRFEKEMVSVSQINQFRKDWAISALDGGQLFICYDSSNVNSQARGVFLVQRGHAKDDPDLDQVNIEYAIRQRDGMPVTFKTFPGSVVDVSQAEEMIGFLGVLLNEQKRKNEIIPLTLICDRGYISEENVASLDREGIDFLLMLRSDLKVTRKILEEHGSNVESSRNYMDEYDQYGMTVEGQLFDDGKTRCFHLFWDPTLEKKNRASLRNAIDSKEKQILNGIKRKTKYTGEEIDRMRRWFSLETEWEGSMPVAKKSKGSKGKEVQKDAYTITSCKRDYDKIDAEEADCGFFMLVSSSMMSALEARRAYARRDCVEKVFQALKSFLGMDKIGVYSSDEAVHVKILVWFVASILHSVIFERTSSLRVTNKKDYTVPAIIDYLEEIVGDKDLSSGEYERRYSLIKKQKNILGAFEKNAKDVDELISELMH